MIEKAEIISFFDGLADRWDDGMITNDKIINAILDNAGICANDSVLDVACGTGVLIPYYLKRGVLSITAIDISPKMVEIAKRKFTQKDVSVICGDVETFGFPKKFDHIVVYNAFPHFPDAVRLIERLSKLVSPGGTLTVAHGMSRNAINAHHSGAAKHVSNGLMTAEELANIFKKHMQVTNVISNEEMYQVVGKNV